MLEDLELVAVQETIKQNFEDWELKELSGNRDFCWICSPAKGHSGGLLLGVDVEGFEIENSIKYTHFIGFLIRNRLSNFRFWVLNVYGPAQHDLSEDFINELYEFSAKVELPIVMGGDFNLIRNNKERNHGQGDQKLMDLFNDFIGRLHLREIFVSGAKFTWSNKQKLPTLVKLDRILATHSWDLNFCNCHAWSKPRVGSDHSPLILDTGEHKEARTKYFYFEERWFQHEEFAKIVNDKWIELNGHQNQDSYSLNNWHRRLQTLRQYLRGWSTKMKGEIKATKLSISNRIEDIDLIAEKILLSLEEWEERISLEGRLEDMIKWDELQWKQKVEKIAFCKGMQIPIFSINL